MLHYILQVITFQLLFLLIYDFFLRKETFFNLNRAYLLGTTILSLVIPFIKIEQIKTIVSKDISIHLPEVFINNSSENISAIDPEIAMQAGINIPTQTVSIWTILLISGMCIATLVLLFKMSKLIWLVSKSTKQWKGNVLIVNLLNSNKAFSFFYYIFLGDHLKAQERVSILQHEMIHVQQKHTLDLLFFEILRIVFWFNPLVYMYQNRMATLHEYIADSKAVKQHDKADYYDNLLAQVFETQQFSFVNPFFKQSLIKKRILMLSKSKSKRINIIKYALLLPMVFTMLIYTSSYAQVSIPENKTEDIKLETQDLSIYSYTMVLGETEMNEEIKATHELYEKFLKSNSNYVSWATFNKENETVHYAVHHINEKVPKGYTKHNIQFKDGTSYFSYMNFSSMFSEDSKVGYDEKNAKTPQIDDAEDIILQQDTLDLEVPFTIIDEVPILESCKDLQTQKERKVCMSKEISKHVNRNFNTSIGDSLGLVGKQRMNVIFKIDKNGDVTDIRARAPHPKLEEEAIRVIKTLPKFIPGKHKGEAVIVPYSLPIIFQVKGQNKDKTTMPSVSEDRVRNLKEKFKNAEEVPFVALDKAPSSEGCTRFDSEKDTKACFSGFISGFVNESFNVDLASKLGLAGKQRISVLFKVDKNGKVYGVKARAPHPELEKEAIRVINNLPQFTPGELNGKPVIVNYSLPILFQVVGKTNTDKKN